jgi:hypothetical protein
VPDWDNTESRERDEDAAWRDLVARFDAPLTAQEPVPWPAREDMPAEADGATEAEEARGSDGKHRGPGADGTDGEPGRHAADGDHGRHAADGEQGRHAAGGDRGAATPNGRHQIDGLRDEPGRPRDEVGQTPDEAGRPRAGAEGGRDGAEGGRDGAGGRRDGAGGTGGGTSGRHGRLEADGKYDPEVAQVPRRIRGPAARGGPGDGTSVDDEEHFIPPTPPPLPKLDPVTKGAWAALFGGPIYLVVATAAGWQVSGLAAFCAVAAFVAGFAILVLRMHEPGPGGPDDGDDGAVV